MTIGCRSLLVLAAAALAGLCHAQGRKVDVSTPEEVFAALNDNTVSEISLRPGVYNLVPLNSTERSLVSILRDLRIRGSADGGSIIRGGGLGSNFRLADIDPEADITVELDQLLIEGFSVEGDGGVFQIGGGTGTVNLSISNSTLSGSTATGDGGAIAVKTGSSLTVRRSRFKFAEANQGGAVSIGPRSRVYFSYTFFEDNVATGARGSAIYALDPDRLALFDSVFKGNRINAVGDGGTINIEGGGIAVISRNIFNDNQDAANSANNLSLQAGAIDPCVIFKSLGCINALVDGNTFIHRPGNIRDVSVRQREGTMAMRNNTFKNIPADGSALIYSSGRLVDGGVTLRGNLLDIDAFSPGSGKDLCRDFAGVGLLQSEGDNIAEDNSCVLDGPGDQPATDPMLETETADGIVALKPGSPAIDSALAAGLGQVSGCSYKDVRGLGRPQDGNLDGVFECDSGAWELQGGPDIGAPQSAAYFDTGRNGEGVFVEILGDGTAFVAMFTYTPDGAGLAWFVGLGDVVGNSIVVDEVLQTSGGVFGASFDPTAVARTDVGGMGLVFSNCESTEAPGRLSFEGELDGPFGNLLSVAGRLSTIVDCAALPGATAGRSGSFFDPARDGEGIFVQWLSNGQVVVIWYTYDPQGNQFWTISTDVNIVGNSLTANMVYPATGTSFGAGFDAAEIVLDDWGTITLTYSGCDSLAFDFDSVVPGFGNGSYAYSRLTTLAGTSCDL